jgi:hypothetical protein
MSIGAYLPDMFQKHGVNMPVFVYVKDNTILGGVIPGYDQGGDQAWSRFPGGLTSAEGYGTVRVGTETRPASISSFLCIKY